MRAVLAVLCAACATAPPKEDPPAQSGSAEAPKPRMVTRWQRPDPPGPLPAVARTEPRPSRVTLANGLEVVVVENHRRRIVSTRLFFPTGAAADAPEQSGATWLAVALLGDTFDELTEDRRPVRYEEKSVARQVAEAGGGWTWGASEDQAFIGIDGYATDTAAYLTRLSDVVRERRHGEASFTARMQAITDALNELELSDSVVLQEHLGRLAFGEGHPYARPVYGTAASLSELTLNDAIDRQQTLLDPRGATLLVVGDVEVPAVLRAATRAFAQWRVGASKRSPVKVPPPRVVKRTQVTFLPRKPSRITTLCAARPLTGVTASEGALDVLARVVGERLGQTLREKSGLTYTASAAVLRYRSAQVLLACSGVVFTDTTAGLLLFKDALAALAAAPPQPAEVERAKAGLVTLRESALDDVSGAMEQWRRALLLGTPAGAARYVAEVKAVTAEQVHALAARVLAADRVQWAVSGEVGPVTAAVKAAGLGRLVTPKLDRVQERAGRDDEDPDL